MTAEQIRERFTKFFVKQQHVALPSSSLVPDNDASVLLTTAGMQQFKPYFLGEKDPLKSFKSNRVTTIQKSFRTSDIDQVGDESHLTFFEMLGNFSFGDYGKKEAIAWAWEFLTKTMHLSKDRLWATVFAGDDEVPGDTAAAKVWQQYLPKEKIVSLGRSDNFWGPAGTTGPCGPSSEIHWQVDPQRGSQPGDGSSNFIEIWNLVFTEYNQQTDKQLKTLPKLQIDTGMGLERLAMVVQKQSSIFEIDSFAPLVTTVSGLAGFGTTGDPLSDLRRQRIVADHGRAAIFLLADGVTFSNKDQGYILRRIVRRAADQFLQAEMSFDPLIDKVFELYAVDYPEIKRNERILRRAIQSELEQYQKVLNVDVQAIVRKMRKQSQAVEPSVGPSHTLLTPTEAFTLYATHGLSLDRLVRQGFQFEREAVEAKIAKHQELSRAGVVKKFGGHGLNDPDLETKYSPEQIFTMTRLHSATHLLHASLRQILGSSVQQKGSDIDPERLRFDFTFERKLTDEEKEQVESLVNEKVSADLPVSWKMMPYKQAIDEGALAFFKEKYGDEVKVYSMGDFSKELCGGPHVEHTKQVGKFTITAEQSVGSGLRRIKAVVA